MGLLISVLTVMFVIICVLLILVILLQSDKSAGMGILGGAGQSTFGSSTADVITKATTAMVIFFMVGSLGLAILESKRGSSLRDKILNIELPDRGVIEESKKEPSADKSGDK
jgi:protein translocase SecG subunit